MEQARTDPDRDPKAAAKRPALARERSWIASRLAYVLFIVQFLKKHKTIRKLLVASLCMWLLLPSVFGVAITIASRLAFAVVFMVVQFGALFWFISRVKTTEIMPGDEYTVTFADYWGQPNLLKMMQEWTTLLKDRGKFLEMGGEPPHGMLLTGKPGTGKTFLAKAMAGSVGIPFVGMEGSGFRGMFWGMDVMRTMQFCGKLRKLARQYGSCIGFLDEIDAVGASRGGQQGGMGIMGGMMGGMGGGALNRLLSEIDGFGEFNAFDRAHNQCRKALGLPPLMLGYVLFIGATNRPEVLDSALIRPGRLGKIIEVDAPDRAGRREIISGYLNRVSHEGVNLEMLVDNLQGSTPAQIKDGIITDAVRIAYFKGHDKVTQADIEAGLMEQALGLANPISDFEPEQELQVALHESGHAVAEYWLMHKEKIARLSIVRRGSFLGVMSPKATTELYALSVDEMVSDIMVCLAGMAAVKVVLGKMWTGGSGDLQHAQAIIRRMTADGFFGPGAYLKASYGEFLEDTQTNFLEQCMVKTEELIQKHVVEVIALRDRLMVEKEMSGEAVIALLDGYNPAKRVRVPVQ